MAMTRLVDTKPSPDWTANPGVGRRVGVWLWSYTIALSAVGMLMDDRYVLRSHVCVCRSSENALRTSHAHAH